ncbi:type II toxin-antitoxin system RelE/ParE family toxin [Testudinibacter aquarius]|uniref:Type II toxin-antitoxin system RelE/ParE family toxin n=1 Tax=Testudinibacter aquarius TaxID=1524974 RepID=A0ABY2XW11_9PAST|nr:type II toxin-antitoxin system RelE/ParE family toxin [Testudinibacter aquarius]
MVTSNKYHVEISDTAKTDLHDIITYVFSQLSAPITALQLLEEFETTIASLVEMPQRIALVRDKKLAAMGYRQISVKKYAIFFRLNGTKNTVNIVRIIYVKRNWAALLNP